MNLSSFLLFQLTHSLDLVAFGDWGCEGAIARESSALINTYLTKTNPDGVCLLGDNFYPDGIDPSQGLSDYRFQFFSKSLARNLDQVPFYTVLGNHDIQQGRDSWLAQLAYSTVQPNWVMPALNYFKRLDANTCVWFLDTCSGTITSGAFEWLSGSLATEADSCTWRIIASHYPLISKGRYRKSRKVMGIRYQLLPVINKHSIDLYISGHDHNSQVLTDKDMPGCKFVIVGAICELVSVENSDSTHGTLEWGSDEVHPVVAQLTISQTELQYSFIHLGVNTVIYQGVIDT